jgi:pimeloyl-ACP methyl ester carboxylesterase
MTEPREPAGYFRNGLPYNRVGDGPLTLIAFPGLMFEQMPLAGLSARMMLSTYRFLEEDYTTYVVGRKPGLPRGYSIQDMADDYAAIIGEELVPPIDVIGTSTGGSIAQHLAADHPNLVRRLVLHANGYTLSDAGKEVQMRIAELARKRRWREASAALLGFVMPASPFGRIAAWFGSFLMALSAPDDPSDLIVTIEAEDKCDLTGRLVEITAPTLVISGTEDPFYTRASLRETAARIPDARLVLYEGKGHGASGRQFERDVLDFLTQDIPEAPISPIAEVSATS